MVNDRNSVQGPSQASNRFRSHDATPPAGGQISGVTRSAARSLLHVLVRDAVHTDDAPQCHSLDRQRARVRIEADRARQPATVAAPADRRSAPARPRREHRPALVARPRPRPRSESAPGWFGWTGKVSATSSAAYCGASRSMVTGSRWLRLMSRWCRASGPPGIVERISALEAALAEGAGFEPAIRFPAYTLSRRAPSATRPPLQPAPGAGPMP